MKILFNAFSAGRFIKIDGKPWLGGGIANKIMPAIAIMGGVDACFLMAMHIKEPRVSFVMLPLAATFFAAGLWGSTKFVKATRTVDQPGTDTVYDYAIDTQGRAVQPDNLAQLWDYTRQHNERQKFWTGVTMATSAPLALCAAFHPNYGMNMLAMLMLTPVAASSIQFAFNTLRSNKLLDGTYNFCAKPPTIS